MSFKEKEYKALLVGGDKIFLKAVKDKLDKELKIFSDVVMADPETAGEVARKISPDLLVVDARSPKKNDPQHLLRLKEYLGHISLIGICGPVWSKSLSPSCEDLFDFLIPDSLENVQFLKKAVFKGLEINKLQESFRQSGERFEAVVNLMPAGFFLADNERKITLWSSQAEEITGHTSEEMIGMSCEKLHAERDGNNCLLELSDDFKKESRFNPLKTKSGEIISIHRSLARTFDDNGQENGYVCVFSDITDLKRREEAFSRLAHVVESSEDAIISVTPEGAIDTWNKGAERIYGHVSDEIMGENISVLLPTEDKEQAAELLKEVHRGEKIEHLEVEHVRKGGTPIFVSLTVSAIHDGGENVEGMSFYARDITKRKYAQDELKKLNRAVEQSASAIVISDHEGKIEYVNPKFTEITGYRIGEVLGRNPRILKSQALPEAVYEHLWDTISSGLDWRGEFCNRKKNGDIYWEMASISPIKDDQGRISHYIKVAEDITEQKESEKKILRLATFPEMSPLPIIETDLQGKVTYINPTARLKFPSLLRSKTGEVLQGIESIFKQLKEEGRKDTVRTVEYDGRIYRQDISYVRVAGKMRIYMTDITEREISGRMKDEIIGVVSHELRTPLSITKEGISLISEGIVGEVNEKQAKILNTAKLNISRLSRIINELLDISKFDSGKVIIRRQMTDLVKLSEDVMNSFTASMMDRDEPQIKSEYSQKPIMLYIDPDKITQVLTNLVANAIRFTEKGFVRLSIEKFDDRVECRVTDTGKGFREDELPKAFDKFQQFGRVAGMGDKGTGLGLPITKSIVELHRGEISIESKYGSGTEVTFMLPIYEPVDLVKQFTERAIDRCRKDGSQMSIICFTAQHDDIDKEYVDRVYEELSDIIHRQLRKVDDFVLRDDDWCMVGLVDCSDIEVIKVAGRLYNRICENLEQKRITDKMKIKKTYATYPYDGTTAGELLEKARKIS